MARSGKPKAKLGREVDAGHYQLVDRISQGLAVAGAESSVVEDDAADKGAALLFDAGKEGCISSLGIVLIPNENKQDRRVAAVSDAFGFVAQLSKRKRIAVLTPKGYVTDFASIPSFAQWLISPFGKHAEAAVVHDWLYTLGAPGDKKGRRLADRTFKRALKLVGVGPVRRNVMYWSVRLGGAGGYGLDTDFDFRDLPKLNKRDPMPDKKRLLTTFKEDDIPKPSKKSAKKDAQDKFVATKST
jgi:Protein of unknown function (DUF1353)